MHGGHDFFTGSDRLDGNVEFVKVQKVVSNQNRMNCLDKKELLPDDRRDSAAACRMSFSRHMENSKKLRNDLRQEPEPVTR